MNYKEKIIEMIENIEKQNILEYLYTYIKMFIEKRG